MSDNIIDIVQRISYQADNSGLEASYKSLKQNLDIINQQQASIERLERLKASTDASSLSRITKINAAIESRKRNIAEETQSIERQIAVNGKLKASIDNQVAALSKLSKSSNTAYQSLNNIGRVAQDLPFGFIGIANNLNPLLESFQRLQKESGGTKGALAALGSSLTGAGGIGLALSVVSSLLLVFGDRLFDVSKDADKAAESYQKFLDTISQTNLGALSAANAEIDKLNILDSILKSQNASQDQKAAALKEIQSLYPGISKEAILQGDVLKQLRGQILAKENSNALAKDANALRALEPGLINDVTKAQEALTKAEIALGKERKANIGTAASEERVATAADKANKARLELQAKQVALNNNKVNQSKLLNNATGQAIASGTTFFGNQGKEPKGPDPYKAALEQAEAQGNIAKETDKALQFLLATEQSNTEVYKLILEQDAEQGISRSLEERVVREQEYKRQQDRIGQIESIRLLELEKGLLLNKAKIAGAFGKEGDKAKFNNEAQQVDIKLSNQKINLILSGEVIPTIDVNNSTIDKAALDKQIAGTRVGKDVIKELLKPAKKENVKKDLDKIVEAYKDFASTVTGIIDGIAQHQLDLLDNEIAYRKERVDYAVTLAARGNTEILNSERDRLEAEQKKREQIAERQLALNSLLAASSAAIAFAQAIQTVTNAGATGDPYSAAARIAAAVAALAAGVAFVSSVVRGANAAGQGFADGVVGLQGPGTEKSDSIPVRLSKGESVITAEATRRYGPMLEAMNAGRPVPYTATLVQNGDYVTKREFAALGEKMDVMTEAVRDSKFSQDVRFDERGIAITTQRAIRRDRNRFL